MDEGTPSGTGFDWDRKKALASARAFFFVPEWVFSSKVAVHALAGQPPLSVALDGSAVCCRSTTAVETLFLRVSHVLCKHGCHMTDKEDGPNSIGAGQKVQPVVLLIGDSPDYPRIFELLASKLQIRFKVVRGCAEGLRALDEARFDIVVMDWQMPEIDGRICTGKIREMEKTSGKRTPVIGITGHVKATLDNCLSAGMDDYLAMPFTYDQLHQKLTFWLSSDYGCDGDGGR